jgi:hypothetical protein
MIIHQLIIQFVKNLFKSIKNFFSASLSRKSTSMHQLAYFWLSLAFLKAFWLTYFRNF